MVLAHATGCGKKQPKMRAVPAGATVLALGDSITFGTGTTPETSYPVVLARLSGWNVINAGIPGNTSTQALERLPALLDEHKPQLVLVSIGGNDFLRRMSEADTRTNIKRICEQAIAAGAQVLLIAVPRPSMVGAVAGSLSDHTMYAELAEELKVPLQRQGWSEILSDAKLRSDQIHANAKGYEQFANRVLDTVRSAGLLEGGKK
ncbi:MAG TPA: GDSL-type esterase/lipase family protein [Ramlibacter sp.]|nr:GDSL-type esterase/lipase family protein [Ramlibacter sp.]